MAARGLPACRLFLVAAALGQPVLGAERDICENKAGAELIRCIEAAARGGGQGPSPEAAKPAAPVAKPSAPAIRQAPAAPTTTEIPRAPAEDCTGRGGEAMRRCLAAGGRLSPEAAVLPPATQTPAAAGRSESCEGKSGEALRSCIEAQSRIPAKAAHTAQQPQIVACTGYTRADQPLCLHRNSAILACRNRSRYPDFEVCLRSHMASAPEPARADCSALQARSRSHCEARNRAYGSCVGDKLAYFACLERQLGADAVLTRR